MGLQLPAPHRLDEGAQGRHLVQEPTDPAGFGPLPAVQTSLELIPLQAGAVTQRLEQGQRFFPSLTLQYPLVAEAVGRVHQRLGPGISLRPVDQAVQVPEQALQ